VPARGPQRALNCGRGEAQAFRHACGDLPDNPVPRCRVEPAVPQPQEFIVRTSRLSVLCAALAIAALPLAASAQVSVNIQVPGLVAVAPPPPRVEPMPGPRPGQVWVPGRWQWGGSAYAWQGGYWQPARADYDYVPGRWVQDRGGWRWVEADWHRGRGGDRHERRERHERDHWDDDGPRGDRYHGDHCPPGQAKKGRC